MDDMIKYIFKFSKAKFWSEIEKIPIMPPIQYFNLCKEFTLRYSESKLSYMLHYQKYFLISDQNLAIENSKILLILYMSSVGYPIFQRQYVCKFSSLFQKTCLVLIRKEYSLKWVHMWFIKCIILNINYVICDYKEISWRPKSYDAVYHLPPSPHTQFW